MIAILYLDDDILIVDKPAGLAVQPGAGVKISVLDVVLRDHGIQGWLVHRLDKDTSGCLLIARSAAAAKKLSGLMESHRIQKTYYLMAFDTPTPPSGILSSQVQAQGRKLEALTHYRLLQSCQVSLPAVPTAPEGSTSPTNNTETPQSLSFSLIEAKLETGRMHQIRQHFAAAGWPLVGDDKYGNFKLNKLAAKHYGAKRLFLTAHSLKLPLNPPVSVNASLPEHFEKLFARLEISPDYFAQGRL